MQNDQIIVIKIGGNIVDAEEVLEEFLDTFSSNPNKKVLIHGGGKIASELSRRLGHKVNMVDGRRITDDDAIDVVTMVYGGLINKTLVAKLQARGVNALGITGADANIIKSHKRSGSKINYGWVGDIDAVNDRSLISFLDVGLTPVIAPLTHDGDGQILNTNADTIAAQVAISLSKSFKVRLVYVFDAPGVLEDKSDPSSIIAQLDYRQFKDLQKMGKISEGMIPKLDNAFSVLDQGVESVMVVGVGSWHQGGAGTVLTKNIN